MVSAIDAHPLKHQLIDMLLKGRPYKEVAAVVGLTPSSVANYCKRYVRPALRNTTKFNKDRVNTKDLAKNLALKPGELMESITRENWLARVRKHEPLMDRAIEKAAESDNFAGVSSVSAARLKALELEAKATGILDERPVTNASFVMMQGHEAIQTIEAEYRYSCESGEENSTDPTE